MDEEAKLRQEQFKPQLEADFKTSGKLIKKLQEIKNRFAKTGDISSACKELGLRDKLRTFIRECPDGLGKLSYSLKHLKVA